MISGNRLPSSSGLPGRIALRKSLPCLAAAAALLAGLFWVNEIPAPQAGESAAHPAAGAPPPPSFPAGASPAIPPAAALPAPATTEEPDGLVQLPQTEQESLQRAIFQAMHAIEPLTEAEAAMPQNEGVSHFVVNPGQNFHASFLADGGVRLASGLPDKTWQGTLRSGAGPWRADGTRAERTAGGITEWYENRADGLEHGFTLNARPADAREHGFRLDLALDGLQVEFDPDHEGGLRFTDPETNEPLLAYRGLKVWDATGRELAAAMQPTGPGLRFTVRDGGAVYPVTIDPLIVSLESRAVFQIELPHGDAAANDVFGNSVSLDGTTALVGAAGRFANIEGAVYVFIRSGGVWTRQAKLTAFDAEAGDRFGNSVSLDGDTALIGADGKNGGRGAAYVFTRSGGVWIPRTKLTPSGAAEGDGFGSSASLDGNTALIGARGKNGHRGAAYVFTGSGNAWTQQAELTAHDAAAFDFFGGSVSLDGNTALVGAESNNDSRGAAYVFTRSGNAWTQQAKLTAGDPGPFDRFGGSVSLDGNTALIGADGKSGSRGAAYVFTRSGNAWTQQAKLTAGDPAEHDVFGCSVSLDGDTALIGAFGKNGNRGAAYVFTRSGNAWTEQAKLTAHDAAADDLFGRSVSLDGTTALIGATGKNGYTGAAYLTDISPPRADNGLGMSVAVGGDAAVVGAPCHHLPGASSAGAAWVLRRRDGQWIAEKKLTSDAPRSFANFGHSVAISGDRVAVGSPYDTAGGKSECGSVSVFDHTGEVWAFAGKLSPAAAEAGLGSSVALDGDWLAAGAIYAGSGAGEAHLWRIGAGWPHHVVSRPAPQEGAVFGWSVALSGNRLVVGEPGFDAPALLGGGIYPNAGCVHFYDLSLSGPSISAVPTGSVTGSRATLAGQPLIQGRGFSVAINGDEAVVGAVLPTGLIPGPGADHVGMAHAFTWNGSTWTAATLDASGFESGACFGSSVAIDGDAIAVGAYYGIEGLGRVRIFQRGGGGWIYRSSHTTQWADYTNNDQYGRAVALGGGRLMVGAPGVAGGGMAYVYTVTDPDAVPVLAITRSGANVVLTWQPAPGWELWRNATLAGPWTKVTVATDGTHSEVIGTRMFFRLQKP